jgi:hypothetical protein
MPSKKSLDMKSEYRHDAVAPVSAFPSKHV